MKTLLVVTLVLCSLVLTAQKKPPVLYDTLGNITTYELHFAATVFGRHKSVHDKKQNKRTLVRTTHEEFQKELTKTGKRIAVPKKKGLDMADFELEDLNGNRVTSGQLAGKVVVINLWFIGCAPCEMERPALNKLREMYKGREDVVFLAFARNTGEELIPYLKDSPIAYNVLPAGKDYIKTAFEVNQYPVNLVVDKKGKYFFYGLGTGIGIIDIMRKQIDLALGSM